VSAANLETLADLARRFKVPVGLSDHIQGLAASIAAVALGASVIERHLVLPSAVDAVDAAFSSTPDEFALLVKSLPGLNQVRGEVRYGPTGPEQDSVKYRRSIYVCADIVKGERLGAHNIKVVRPGLGLAPRYWSQLMGSVARRDLHSGEPLQLSDVDIKADAV
jgi:N-acetylneuraminate synthase